MHIYKTEKDLSKAIIKKLNNLDISDILNKQAKIKIYAYKRIGSGMSANTGMPDISGCVSCQINNSPNNSPNLIAIRLEIEVKLPGKKPTDRQAYFIEKYASLGCIAFWTDDISDCMEQLLNQLKTKLPGLF